MLDDVQIVLFDRKNNSKQNISLKVNLNERIETIVNNVETLTNIPSSELEVIFCGKKIGKNISLQDLSIGPSTQIMVLRAQKIEKTTETDSSAGSSRDVSNISSFFVFCKKCENVEKGKLRVYCQDCSSTSVLVKAEPQNWSDVLKSKKIRVNCENCRGDDVYAQFKFKCVTCNEISPALTHARGNWQLAECCICDEKEQMIFDLGCHHPICQPCFKQYLTHTLSNFSFIYQPPHGYTISCPFQGCARVVQDVHHFYIMGKQLYDEYQKRATEKLVSLDDEGVVCPNPKCGQFFYWEPYDDDGRSQCPDCFFSFCRKCNERVCQCHNPDDSTKLTIEATTRKCPKCQVSTERNGGCSHIHCTSCGMDWCFKCVGPWTEECQWDHWF